MKRNRTEKMPDSTNGVIEMLNNISPLVTGAILAVFMATLRVVYDGTDTKPRRLITEGLMSGGLGVTFGFGLQALNMSDSWIIFVCCAIGHIGVMNVRTLAMKFLNKKIDKQ